MSVTLITKNHCTQCGALKMFLKFGLSDKYAQDIKIVNKETDVEEFEKLTSTYNILTLPAFISGDEVLTKTQPTQVTEFLHKHVGKK